MSLFPIIQPETTATETEFPLFREVRWNYKEDKPVFQNGEPKIVEGNEAILVWIWNALHTVRRRHEIYTWDYGNDVEELIGQPFTEELKRSEAARYVRECLMINPYITDVREIEVTFSNGALLVSCGIDTVYGEINYGGELNV